VGSKAAIKVGSKAAGTVGACAVGCRAEEPGRTR
jgi:hypothetical protein